jgi:hypothetical protein
VHLYGIPLSAIRSSSFFKFLLLFEFRKKNKVNKMTKPIETKKNRKESQRTAKKRKIERNGKKKWWKNVVKCGNNKNTSKNSSKEQISGGTHNPPTPPSLSLSFRQTVLLRCSGPP